jgi:capsular polysaccharide transport system permease protein
MRVIGTLVLRETRATFGTSQIGYLWAIITPTVGVGLLVVIFSMVDRKPPFGPSLALFFATGILTIELFNKLSTTLMSAFEANAALLTYPLLRATDTLYARTLLIALTYAVIMAIFYGVLAMTGLGAPPRDPGQVLAAFGATVAIGFGLGAVNAVLLGLWESWKQIEKILTRPLIFISGVFYVPSALPPEAVAILWWNPVLHLVEWMRVGFYPTYDSIILTPWYPLSIALALTLLGLAGERVTRLKRR